MESPIEVLIDGVMDNLRLVHIALALGISSLSSNYSLLLIILFFLEIVFILQLIHLLVQRFTHLGSEHFSFDFRPFLVLLRLEVDVDESLFGYDTVHCIRIVPLVLLQPRIIDLIDLI
jgi:hypothetical protein